MLTQREQDVFNNLWKSEQGLTAKEIVDISDMSINTVQAMLKKLKKQGLIEVSNIVYSRTVLCRVWRPTEASGGMIAEQLLQHYQQYQHIVPKQMFLEVLEKM